MPALAPRTARELAYRVLVEHREGGAWVQELLARSFAAGTWSPADRGLATELTCGVVRRQAALTAVLQPQIARPWDQIEPDLITLLWLGTYQLLYLDRVPRFAAIHETVEVCRAIGQTRWTGFVNGVLRSVDRLVTDEFTDVPAADAVPISAGRYRKLQRAVFPSPETHRAGYIATAFSLPEWLAERWTQRWPAAELIALAAAINETPVLFARPNPRRTTPEELYSLWQAHGATCKRVGDSALRLDHAGNVELLPGYHEGLFSLQDLTAMRAVEALQPRAGERIWDVCAAPGTKTCQLAERMDDRGEILATDASTERLTMVEDGLHRLGLTCVRTLRIRPDGVDLPDDSFDAVLLDAPCSNTGVLHRRPEARWRLQPDDITELAATQRQLLRAALDRVAPHGRLLYATCSIEPEENEAVVREVLSQRPEFTLADEFAALPGPHGDGGYQALLIRKSD
ncbi:MAG TPA: transcription antitermination factor NusB [Planctomycetaceae bacterium]|nr:transcription antitermination factor NusB [Planctomycetaceae bacterium]